MSHEDQNDNDSKVVLINSDSVTFDYAVFILKKVFGMDKKQAYEAATMIDRHGEWSVLECNKQEAQEALDKINNYNEASNNNLVARVDPINAPSVKIEDVITKGHCIVLSYNDKLLLPEDNKNIVLAIMSSIHNPNKLNDKEVAKQARHWVEDMFFGKDILIKEFENTDAGLKKATAFMDILEYKLEKTLPKEVSLSLKKPGYVLKSNPDLPRERKTIEEKNEDIEMLNLIGGFVDDVENKYLESVEKRYGSLENFLEKANQEELDEYEEVQKSLKKMEEIKEANSIKPNTSFRNPSV